MRIAIMLTGVVLVCQHICYGQTQTVNTSEPINLRLNLESATGAQEKDVFDHVRFIPLETTSKSLFGRVNQMVVIDEYFIILDKDTNCILFFDKTGKFINKIEGGNKATDPRKIIVKFIVNKYRNEVIVKTLGIDKYFIYGFDCKKKGEIAGDKTLMTASIAFLSEDTYVLDNGYPEKNEIKNRSFISFIKNNKEYASALPHADADHINHDVRSPSGANGPFYYFGNDTLRFYTKPYDYNIYNVSADKTKVAYKLLFTVSNALPGNFLTDPAYNDKRTKYIDDNKSVIYALSNCYKINNYLLFKVNSSDWSAKKNFVYDLKNQRLICYDRITPDETSSYLTIAPVGLDYSNNGLTADGENIYTSVSAVDLLKDHNRVKSKNAEQSIELNKFIKRNDRLSNSVIIQLHLKK